MTSAPERIIAWPSKSFYQGVSLGGGHPDKMIEYIRADLCRPEPQGWQPIETAPEEELVLVSGRHECGSPWWNIGRRYGTNWDMIWIVTIDPTHWMPLPAPPKP